MTESILAEHIVIVGAMGAGKTTVGEGLARRLRRSFIDSDRQIRERTGIEGALIATADGVEALHALEREVFLEAITSEQAVVVAAAASVIEDEEIRGVLEQVRCVWLRADDESLASRQVESAHRRPLGIDEAARIAARAPLYEACADVTLDTTGLAVEDAVSMVLDGLGEGGRGV